MAFRSSGRHSGWRSQREIRRATVTHTFGRAFHVLHCPPARAFHAPAIAEERKPSIVGAYRAWQLASACVIGRARTSVRWVDHGMIGPDVEGRVGKRASRFAGAISFAGGANPAFVDGRAAIAQGIDDLNPDSGGGAVAGCIRTCAFMSGVAARCRHCYREDGPPRNDVSGQRFGSHGVFARAQVGSPNTSPLSSTVTPLRRSVSYTSAAHP